MLLTPDFVRFVREAARAYLVGPSSSINGSNAADLITLGRWGEGYLTSLASARRVLNRYLLNGIRRNPDVQLNDGSCGLVVQMMPKHVPWRYLRHSNKGEILGTATSHSRFPNQTTPPCVDYLPTELCVRERYTSLAAGSRCNLVPTKKWTPTKTMWWERWRNVYCYESCGRPTLALPKPCHRLPVRTLHFSTRRTGDGLHTIGWQELASTGASTGAFTDAPPPLPRPSSQLEHSKRLPEGASSTIASAVASAAETPPARLSSLEATATPAALPQQQAVQQARVQQAVQQAVQAAVTPLHQRIASLEAQLAGIEAAHEKISE